MKLKCILLTLFLAIFSVTVNAQTKVWDNIVTGYGMGFVEKSVILRDKSREDLPGHHLNGNFNGFDI